MSDRHQAAASYRRLGWTLALTLGFVFVEVLGGLRANSLALLSDAGHMFTDVVALTLALVAMRQSRRRPDARRTFGYRRLEVLAALANGVLLVWIAGAVAREAWQRFARPTAVDVPLMFGVATVGLVVNLVGILLLHRHQHESLNVRAALFHLLGDALSSLGAMAAAISLRVTGWLPADALASFLICLLILAGGLHLVRESVHYLMEGAPAEFHLSDVDACLRRHPEVRAVHDLHVWRISPGMDILTTHLVLHDIARSPEVRAGLRKSLRETFGLSHCTIEVEGIGEQGHPDQAHAVCDDQDA